VVEYEATWEPGVAVMNIKKPNARWAGVEFQPDLSLPRAPVRLGLVLQTGFAGDDSAVVIGRMPMTEHRPPEFQHINDLTMRMATDWVRIMSKDTFDVDHDQLFASLAAKWRSNLYVIEPIEVVGTLTEPLSLAKRLYKQFVGVPFGRERRSAPRTRAGKPGVRSRSPFQEAELPPAWQLKEIMERSVGSIRAF
jgi:hypothetical protein